MEVYLVPRSPHTTASPFHDGLCPARRINEKKMGYVDLAGRFVIPPQYDKAKDFSCGRAVVEVDGKRGMIDTVGRWIVKPGVYKWIEPCRDGIARCTTHGDRVVSIGREGELVAFSKRYQYVGEFSDGFADCEDADGNWFYIDRQGEVRVRLPKETLGREFSNGLAAVEPDDDGDNRFEGNAPGRCGFINKQGKVVITRRYRSVGPFREGLGAVSLTDPSHFIRDVVNIRGGLRNLGSGGWGFIDTDGKVVIPLQYEKVGWFSEGLARFRHDGKWGYLDRTGKVVIPPEYDAAGDFENGLALVTPSLPNGAGPICFIDHAGKVVINTGQPLVDL
jgi:hypothetical protein